MDRGKFFEGGYEQDVGGVERLCSSVRSGDLGVRLLVAHGCGAGGFDATGTVG